VRKDAFLFGEAQSRVIVSVAPSRETEFIDFMLKTELPFSVLGHVTRGECRVDDISYGFICDLMREYNSALEETVN
jgi:phosphoribosylformylglycinamidine synthase